MKQLIKFLDKATVVETEEGNLINATYKGTIPGTLLLFFYIGIVLKKDGCKSVGCTPDEDVRLSFEVLQ